MDTGPQITFERPGKSWSLTEIHIPSPQFRHNQWEADYLNYVILKVAHDRQPMQYHSLHTRKKHQII